MKIETDVPESLWRPGSYVLVESRLGGLDCIRLRDRL